MAFFVAQYGQKEFPMSFAQTLKHALATAILAGSAAVLTVMAQRSAFRTVEALARPEQPQLGA